MKRIAQAVKARWRTWMLIPVALTVVAAGLVVNATVAEAGTGNSTAACYGGGVINKPFDEMDIAAPPSTLQYTTIPLRVPAGATCKNITVDHGFVYAAPASICVKYRVRATYSSGGYDYGDWFLLCNNSGAKAIYTNVRDGTVFRIEAVVMSWTYARYRVWFQVWS